MTETVSLFVYGSFSENMVHYDLLSQFVTAKEPAAMEAFAYRLEVGYPVLSLEARGTGEAPCWVSGQLLEVQAEAVLFKLLDEFHGWSPVNPEKSLFFKTTRSVRKSDGSELSANCYVINPAKLPKTAQIISGGDWQAALSDGPPFTEQLTDRQRAYVLKLGASTGRDIVPIDLDLYRQLMKLELIVDKGRRLALTKLGKEVYRYLPKRGLGFWLCWFWHFAGINLFSQGIFYG